MSGDLLVAPAAAPGPVDVFLAGGIRGTDVWQTPAGHRLTAAGLTVASPRRPGLLDDPSTERDQVRWEADHLERSKVILFWFPGPGDHPVAMYELGRWAATDKPIIVGCPPDYARRTNIVTQLSILRPDATVQTNLEAVLDETISRLGDQG